MWGISLALGGLFAGLARGNVDLYLDPEQTEVLFGKVQQQEDGGGEEGIYYVREGVVSQYALNFQEKKIIPPSLPRLLFHWLATTDAKVSYSVHVIHSAGPAMGRPRVNVSAVGVVPDRDSVVAVEFPCVGKGEVDFLLQFKFAFNQTKTETLNFKGKKVCDVDKETTRGAVDAGQPPIVVATPSVEMTVVMSDSEAGGSGGSNVGKGYKDNKEEGGGGAVSVGDDGGGKRGGRRDPNSTTVVALGAAAGAVALMAVLLTVMYVTRQKRMPAGVGGGGVDGPLSSSHHPSYLGAASGLKLRGGNNAAVAAANIPPGHSAADFVRRKAASGSKRSGGGYNYRFNGGMGVVSNGGSGVGYGSYATLASFTNVPMNAPIGRSQMVEGGTYRRSADQSRAQWLQQQHRYQQQHNGVVTATPASNQRWLNHYGSNQSSIWSSSQTMTSTMRGGSSSAGRGNGSSSQSTIFGRRPPPLQQHATEEDEDAPPPPLPARQQSLLQQQQQPPQQNSLVLENGMLKLCPRQDSQQQRRQDDDNGAPVYSAPQRRPHHRRRDTDTLKSNKTEEEIREMRLQMLSSQQNPLPASFYHDDHPQYGRVHRGGRHHPSNTGSNNTDFVTLSDDDDGDIDGVAEGDDVDGDHSEPFSLYTPQIYPHLMPQNIAQAQKGGHYAAAGGSHGHTGNSQQLQPRMPRSSSGGSVLV